MELLPGTVQLVAVAHIHVLPVRILLQLQGLCMPVLDIGLQAGLHGFGIAPAFGGQQFDALRQQGSRFALHLGAGVQIFDALNALGQLVFKRQQRFAAQGRARFGRIALPGHGVGNVEAAGLQQGLGAGGPFGRECLLPLAAFDVIELFAQRLGSTFVAQAQLLVHLLHGSRVWLCGQPGTHFGRTLTRSGCAEDAACAGIQRVFGRSGGVGVCASGRWIFWPVGGIVMGVAEEGDMDHVQTSTSNKKWK